MPNVKDHVPPFKTNVERFLAGVASPPNLRFAPNATRWDIQSLQGLPQLFDIAKVALRDPPFLHLTLDGGDLDALERIKESLNKTLPGTFEVAYRWVPPACRHVAAPDASDAKSWPYCRFFEIVSPKSVAFHGGMNDLVILLPPEDLSERNKRWRDYLTGSWVVVVYEQEPAQQKKLVAEFSSSIDTRADQRRHTPWLFTANPDGNLTSVPCRQYGVQSLPTHQQR